MVRVCIDIPRKLYNRVKKIGSVEDIIIEALKNYVEEIEHYEKVSRFAEEIFR